MLSRRRFLSRSVAGTAGLLILPSSYVAFGDEPNRRLNLAIIGHMYVAGHFFSSVHAYENVDIVALCNPDARKIPETFKIWREQAEKLGASTRAEEQRGAEKYRRLLETKPRIFADFREMLDEMGNEIDAVIVSMFDHYHGPACGAAMRAGKHVFSERPLGRTIGEARALRELAAQQQVATSIRNPGNASNPFRRGVEIIRQGIIGRVEEVHIWFDRAGPDLDQTPQGTLPVPDGLHWDLWLGPAAARPYHPEWMAYAHWREFSNGGIGTFGPHAANLAFAALNVQTLWERAKTHEPPAIIRVRAECSRINRISFPRWEKISWRIPARADLPPITFTWHHGAKLSPGSREFIAQHMGERGASPEEQETLLGYAGALIIGSKGALATDDHNVKFTLLPRKEFANVPQDKPLELKPSRGHYHDWFLACRGGEQPWASYRYAGPLSEFLMLGNVATQFDAELEYDPVAGKIVNNAEANTLLSYQFRDGWVL